MSIKHCGTFGLKLTTSPFILGLQNGFSRFVIAGIGSVQQFMPDGFHSGRIWVLVLGTFVFLSVPLIHFLILLFELRKL